jgi:amino-acid N-acetyltransferase
VRKARLYSFTRKLSLECKYINCVRFAKIDLPGDSRVGCDRVRNLWENFSHLHKFRYDKRMSIFQLQAATSAQQNGIKDLVRAARLNPLGLDWRRFVVAVDEEGEIIGCGQLKPHRDGSWELASIVVVPAWRGQGVARVVIEHLLVGNPRPLWLTCVSRLVPFYARFGFSEVTALADMPPYFRWVSRLFRFLAWLSPANSLSVMCCD